MKKIAITFTFFFSLVFIFNVSAQKIELTPFAGYTFQDKIPIELGEATINGGLTYGGIFTAAIGKRSNFEFAFTRIDAKATAYSAIPGFIDMEDKVSVNYIMAGIIWPFPVNKEMKVFGGINIGTGIVASKTDRFETMTKFAIGVDGGIKYTLNENIGLRLQAYLNTPVTDEGGTIWWSSGSGTNAGSTSYFPLTQFGITAGLIFYIK